jgi:hypothetical protein
MDKRRIALLVTFVASYVGDDQELEELTTVEETASLVIPQLDDKFVVFPKVLEGVTAQVIAAHNSKVYGILEERARKEKEERERAKMLPFPSLANGKH